MSVMELSRPVKGHDAVAFIKEAAERTKANGPSRQNFAQFKAVWDANHDAPWEAGYDGWVERLACSAAGNVAVALKHRFSCSPGEIETLLTAHWDLPRNFGDTVFPSEGVCFGDLLNDEVGPVEELIPGLIEKGVATMLAGPGGTHKSRTAVHWGLAISAGAPVYGRPTQKARFIFLSYEDHVDEVTRRTQAITRRLKLEYPDNAEYWNKRDEPEPIAIISENEGVLLQPFYHRLQKYLTAIPGHKFVVLDSTYNVLEFRGNAKINEPSVKAAIELLNRLCDDTDSTIMFLWHPSQAGQERGDMSGWSVAWHNAPRARLSLSRARTSGDKVIDGAFDLKVEKRNNGPTGETMTLHWDNGVLLPMTDVDVGEIRARFLEATIKVALMAAEANAPIKRKGAMSTWQLEDIERAIGRRPSQSDVRDELERAIGLKRLRYVGAKGHTLAGYRAWDDLIPDYAK